MTRPRKPKVKRTDWEKLYEGARLELKKFEDWKAETMQRAAPTADFASILGISVHECTGNKVLSFLHAQQSTLASLTEQLKVKDARIAELADVASQQSLEIINLRDHLQATRDRDDELMAAQRTRLIRLTEIVNLAGHAANHFGGYYKTHFHNFGTSCVFVTENWEKMAGYMRYVRKQIAALEVDSTLPGIPPKGTK